MVKNKRQKGNRNQRKAIEHYTSDGWLVDKVEKTGKFITDKDLFGLFDLVGIKPNQTIFIQVKTNRPPPKRIFSEFAGSYAHDNLLVESYTWYDNDGPRILQYLHNGSVDCIDLRKSSN